MTADRLALLFPALSGSGYEVTSPAAPDYNCIAWAADDTSRWWEPVPIPLPSYYWPPGVAPELTLASYVQAFESIGYRICGDDTLQEGVEKIAVYVSADGFPTHAARQLASGSGPASSARAWISDIAPSPRSKARCTDRLQAS
jgi:hypothetical protein